MLASKSRCGRAGPRSATWRAPFERSCRRVDRTSNARARARDVDVTPARWVDETRLVARAPPFPSRPKLTHSCVESPGRYWLCFVRRVYTVESTSQYERAIATRVRPRAAHAFRRGAVAQLVERALSMREVPRSKLGSSTDFLTGLFLFDTLRYRGAPRPRRRRV